MSVSSADIGVCRTLNGSLAQYYMETTDEDNYFDTPINNIAVSDAIAGLGQQPDEAADNSGNWVSNITAPFPSQCTYVMSFAYLSATKTVIVLETTTQALRVINLTTIPVYDDSAGMWDDLAAQSVATGDKFITANVVNLKAKSNTVSSCTATTASTTSVNYYQPQLQSSDYWYVGSDGDDVVPSIAVAWNTGTTYF